MVKKCGAKTKDGKTCQIKTNNSRCYRHQVQSAGAWDTYYDPYQQRTIQKINSNPSDARRIPTAGLFDSPSQAHDSIPRMYIAQPYPEHYMPHEEWVRQWNFAEQLKAIESKKAITQWQARKRSQAWQAKERQNEEAELAAQYAEHRKLTAPAEAKARQNKLKRSARAKARIASDKTEQEEEFIKEHEKTWKGWLGSFIGETKPTKQQIETWREGKNLARGLAPWA